MAFSEFEETKVELELHPLIERMRPPEDIRSKVDVAFRIEGQSVILIERRPYWKDASQIIEHEFAKATFVKDTGNWKIYWKRASGKWDRYEPVDTLPSLEAWIQLVNEDAHGCFKG